MWYLKRFYVGLTGLHKTFGGTPQRSVKIKIEVNFYFKVRTQQFVSEKFLFFFVILSFYEDLTREYLVVLKFLLEVSKFKKNGLICVITIIKVYDLSLTLLQVKPMFVK